MKLYERIENNNFDEIDRNRAIELIESGNGHLVYNENYFKLQKENKELKENCNIDYKRECEVLALQLHLLREEAKTTEKDYNMLKEYYKEQNEVNARFIPVLKIEAKIEELDIAILE